MYMSVTEPLTWSSSPEYVTVTFNQKRIDDRTYTYILSF